MSVSMNNPGAVALRGPRSALIAGIVVLAAILVAAWLSADRPTPVEESTATAYESSRVPIGKGVIPASAGYLDAPGIQTAAAASVSVDYLDVPGLRTTSAVATPVAPAPFTGFHVDEAGVVYGFQVDEAGVVYGYDPLQHNACALVPTSIVGVPQPC